LLTTCRNWILVEEGVEARNVNGILGLLCREHFPGLVYKSEEDVEGELPSFDQYALFPVDEPYRNLADQVISELWVSLSRSTTLISLLSLDILEIK
jgi:hypothetical protein